MGDVQEYRCFVGGLSRNTTDQGLEDAFRSFGNVLDAKVNSYVRREMVLGSGVLATMSERERYSSFFFTIFPERKNEVSVPRHHSF
jgi:RNA recognition motif-containing protein